jgi:hypothetical protein
MANKRKKNSTNGFGFGRGVGDLDKRYILVDELITPYKFIYLF